MPCPASFAVNAKIVWHDEDLEKAYQRALASESTRANDQDKLTHLLGPRFPLESAVEAHQAVEASAIGNVTLDVAPPTSENLSFGKRGESWHEHR